MGREDNGLRLVWWLLGILATIATAGGGLWISSVSDQIHEFQSDVKELRRSIDLQIKEMQKDTSTAIAQRSDRLAVVEVKQAVQDMRLETFEKKLDKVLDLLEKTQGREDRLPKDRETAKR